jgi:two-component system, cell cycle response regulator
MNIRTEAGAHELVPLAERTRYMRAFRLIAAALVVGGAAALPGMRAVPVPEILTVTAAYAVIALLGEALWHVAARRALPFFGALLILDGVFLAWVSYVAVDPESPLRYLVVGHLVTVALLASFRTGLKLALWHSLLLLAAFHLDEAGILEASSVGGVAVGDESYLALIGYILAFWLIAISTASFAAVNERELRRRRYDMEALGALALRLEALADSRSVGQALVEAVAEDFGFERVALVAAPHGELTLVDHHGGATPAALPPARADGVLARALGGHDPLLVADFASADEPLLAAVLPGAVNLVVVPLHAEGRDVGVLVCEHSLRRASRIERRVVSMLSRYASQSALALRNAWLVAQLARSAVTDGLTGVPNRRAFDEALAREASRATRTGDPLGLVMLDIDHFKRLNDTLGHQAGDEALRSVARALAGEVRLSDTVARYGGEEFVVLLPGLDGDEALVTAERLRAAVAAAHPGVTVSAGVAAAPYDAADPRSLVEAADRALYASKRCGRDRATRASGAA